MKKILLIFCVSGLMFSCKTSSNDKMSSEETTKIKMADPVEFASSITSDELKTMLYTYASDEFEGRETGEKGQKMAVEYLKSQYKDMGIPTYDIGIGRYAINLRHSGDKPGRGA